MQSNAVDFESWLASQPALQTALKQGEVSFSEVCHDAVMIGIIVAMDPQTQSDLNMMCWYVEHCGEVWAMNVALALDNGEVDKAAEILWEHGLVDAPCCGSKDPHCLLALALQDEMLAHAAIVD